MSKCASDKGLMLFLASRNVFIMYLKTFVVVRTNNVHTSTIYYWYNHTHEFTFRTKYCGRVFSHCVSVCIGVYVIVHDVSTSTSFRCWHLFISKLPPKKSSNETKWGTRALWYTHDSFLWICALRFYREKKKYTCLWIACAIRELKYSLCVCVLAHSLCGCVRNKNINNIKIYEQIYHLLNMFIVRLSIYVWAPKRVCVCACVCIRSKVKEKKQYSPNLQAPIFFHFSAIVDDLSINNFSWFRIVLRYIRVVFYAIAFVHLSFFYMV